MTNKIHRHEEKYIHIRKDVILFIFKIAICIAIAYGLAFLISAGYSGIKQKGYDEGLQEGRDLTFEQLWNSSLEQDYTYLKYDDGRELKLMFETEIIVNELSGIGNWAIWDYTEDKLTNGKE